MQAARTPDMRTLLSEALIAVTGGGTISADPDSGGCQQILQTVADHAKTKLAALQKDRGAGFLPTSQLVRAAQISALARQIDSQPVVIGCLANSPLFNGSGQ